MKTGNIYYASDKAIYDALLQRKFTNVDLKELLLDRGIFMADSTPRDDIALYFSRLNHDYFDHQKIASVLSVANRKEKTSVTYFSGIDEISDMESTIHRVADNHNKLGNKAEVVATKYGYEIRLTYSAVDYNKSEFKQVTLKNATMSFEKVGNEVVIRGPHNDTVGDTKQSVLDLLQEKNGDLEINNFDLSDIPDAKTRTEFFQYLIDGLADLSVYDVSDASVNHPSLADKDGDEPDFHVRKVALSGKRILNAPELGSLLKKGFYTFKVRWQVFGGHAKPDRYELEAQFEDADACKGFSYSILGRYAHKGIGANTSEADYASSRKNVSSFENTVISKKLEASAKDAIRRIREKIEGQSGAVSAMLEVSNEEL